MISENLSDPSKLNIMLRSKSLEKETDQQEKWYGTKYKVEEFPASLLEKINNPKIDFKRKVLDLPPENNLIPKNFDILPKK
jgi:insulysin